VARLRTRIERAAALHRQAAALASAAASALEGYSPSGAPVEQYNDQHDLAASLRSDAAALAPGWLSAGLDALPPSTPLGGPLPPTFVRVGMAQPLDDARFPVVVPLLRAGHIAIDADARDNRVAGLLRSLVLRLLAASPPGSIRIRTVDAAEIGVFRGFTGIEAIMPPPVTDTEGLRAVLDEGERWLSARAVDGHGPTLLVVIASLPELTEGRDLTRIAALAHGGPAGRLHLIAAGWPPPPLTAETTQAPLPHATQIALRNPHSWIGDPPGATFAAGGVGPGRLSAPVYLDADPPTDLVRVVCAQLAAPWTAPPTAPGEPSRTSWRDYIGAAQRLDAARRSAATVVADHKKALSAAREDLAVVRAKLQHHQSRLAEIASLAGRPVDATPTWQDAQAAQATLASPPARPPGPPPPLPARPAASALPAPPVSAPPRMMNHNTGPIALGPPTGGYPIVATRPPAAGRPTSAPPTGWPSATGPIPVSGAVTGPGHTGPIPTGPFQTGPVPAGPVPTGPIPTGSPSQTGPIPISGPPRPVSPAIPVSPAPGSVPARASAALRMAAATLDASEADLVDVDKQTSGDRLWTNFLVYGGFTLVAIVIQLPILLYGGGVATAVALPFGVVAPIIAFGLGWLVAGAVAPKGSSRNPGMGAGISLLALLPVIVLIGTFFIG
jgi:hypothetical protein